MTADFFSDDMRRNPFAAYDQMRRLAPAFLVPPPFDAWMIFDYDGVKRVLGDHETFSSAVPAPRNWFTFSDPPAHTRLHALIARGFTPKVIAAIEPRIREISRQLLDEVIERGTMDLATEYAVPLPMKVIAELIGIPAEDWPRFRRWSDMILRISYGQSGGDDSSRGLDEFRAATAEMDPYLAELVEQRRRQPRADLLTRLVEAEVDGERLTHEELLGFFQLLLVGGQETTANLINNAVLCFLEHPLQLARVKENLDLLPSAIEEVLRFRSPVQWLMRTPTSDVEMHGKVIEKGKLVLTMIGSANRDPAQFPDPSAFDITRRPNPHLAFGQGIHFCLGAALSRLEARIALTDILARLTGLALANSQPWPPRNALHVHGPASLPVQFVPGD
jgi:cytochrome P450